MKEALVAKKVKHWPAVLAIQGSSSDRVGKLFNRNRVSFAHSLSLLSTNRPMTEILLKRT